MINKIKKRIKEIRDMKKDVSGHGTKTKYNFAIGELLGVLELIEDEKTS